MKIRRSQRLIPLRNASEFSEIRFTKNLRHARPANSIVHSLMREKILVPANLRTYLSRPCRNSLKQLISIRQFNFLSILRNTIRCLTFSQSTRKSRTPEHPLPRKREKKVSPTASHGTHRAKFLYTAPCHRELSLGASSASAQSPESRTPHGSQGQRHLCPRARKSAARLPKNRYFRTFETIRRLRAGTGVLFFRDFRDARLSDDRSGLSARYRLIIIERGSPAPNWGRL